RILVADDDACNRLILQDMLLGAGHEVVLAEDGIAAWALLQQPDAPKLAVLDWLMPGLDGLEVIQKAQALFQAEPVYCILLTANDDNEDMVRALDAGANDYLTKPFNQPELLARVQVGVRMVQLQSSLARRLKELQSALAGSPRSGASGGHERPRFLCPGVCRGRPRRRGADRPDGRAHRRERGAGN